MNIHIDDMYVMALEMNCITKGSDYMFNTAAELNEVVDNMFLTLLLNSVM